ncbi:MAG: hypothetical protein IPM98_17870 [Lewinellaceae bacterium]|nr:hypothetical protein [Lewinellaceae bacterium]
MAIENPNTLTPMRRMVRLLAKYRREIRYILLYAVVAGLINLSLPLGIQAIIGLIAGGGISASWGLLVAFVIVGAIITGGLRLLQLSIMEHMQRQVLPRTRLSICRSGSPIQSGVAAQGIPAGIGKPFF